jgi:hypothetical protein
MLGLLPKLGLDPKFGLLPNEGFVPIDRFGRGCWAALSTASLSSSAFFLASSS